MTEPTLWEQVIDLFKSWFVYQNVSVLQVLAGLGLALGFGAVWLAAHWPPLFKRPSFWLIAVVSAFLTMLAVVFVQYPIQYWYDRFLLHFWDLTAIDDWLLLAGIPAVLVSGLVQEGAKMAPMAVFWLKHGRRITPAMGLAIGAVAGAAFGVFEAFWVAERILGAGWTVAAFGDGFFGIAGFWERFFAVGFHTAVSAMIGYGLARGQGWQYYLVGSAFHALFNYGRFFLQKGYFSLVQLETVVAVIAVLLSAVVLIVRWRITRDFPGEGAYDPDRYVDYSELGLDEPPEEENAAQPDAAAEKPGEEKTD